MSPDQLVVIMAEGDERAAGLSLEAGYACAVGAPGEGPIIRNARAPYDYITTPDPTITNLHSNFLHGVSVVAVAITIIAVPP